MWHCSVTFHRDPIKFPTKYHYGLNIADCDVNVPHYGKFECLSTPPSSCEEKYRRYVKRQVQFDVFYFPDCRHRDGETIPTSVIWYLKWFLQFVKDATISEILTKIEGYSYNFRLLTTHHVKELVKWIWKQVNLVTEVQRLYLRMVLSHLCENNIILLYRNYNKRVRGYFITYVHFIYLSTLDIEEFQKWVTALFSCLRVENRDEHKKLLNLVMKSAPTLDAAFSIFEVPRISTFFATENESDEFFVEFCREALKTNENRKDLGKKLSEIPKLPARILRKLQGLVYSALSEYAKSDGELQGEDIQSLVELIFSIKDHGMDKFVKILMELSTSKSVPRQDLLLQILDELFKGGWLEIPFEKTVDICNSWVITRVTNFRPVSSLESFDKVAAVYDAIESIARRFSSVPIAKTLLHEVSIHVAEKMFEDEDAINVLQAYARIEKLSPEVQECYITHVRKILTPDLIKKSSHLITKYLGSRYVLLTL